MLPVSPVEVPHQVTASEIPTAPAAQATTETTSVVPPEPAAESTGPQWPGIVFSVWAIGTAAAVLWAAVSYGKLRRRISDAVLIERNIYETDQIDTPFVCGLIKPRIYLPVGMNEADRRYVLLHEQAHIKRLDYLTKPLAYLILCIHWFNPLLWLSYFFFCRDVETACDQAVTNTFDRQDTAGYATALLHLGQNAGFPNAVPLGFGEENAKGRIKSVLSYQKPAFWIALLAVIAVILAAVLLLSNPDENDRLEGVAITEAYVLDGGFRVDLPRDLKNDLLSILNEHDQVEYTPLEGYLPKVGTVVLFGRSGEPVYYFDDSIYPILSKEENGTYSAAVKLASASEELMDSSAYSDWLIDLEHYLSEDLADQLYKKKVPYIGDAAACTELLEALHLSEVAGPYTIELQTETEPYGITVTFEQFPVFPAGQELLHSYCADVADIFLSQVENAGKFAWRFDPEQASASTTAGNNKTLSQARFRSLYGSLRRDAGAYCAAVSQTVYVPREVVYVSPNAFPGVKNPEELLLSDSGNSTITIRPDLFSVDLGDIPNAAEESFENPSYQAWEFSQFPGVDLLYTQFYSHEEAMVISDSSREETRYAIYYLDEETFYLARLDRADKHYSDWTLDYLIRIYPQVYSIPPLPPQ